VRNQGFFANFEVRNVRKPVTFLRFLRFLTFSEWPDLASFLGHKGFHLCQKRYGEQAGGQVGGQAVGATGVGTPTRRESRELRRTLPGCHIAAPEDGTPRGAWIFDF